MLAYIKGNIVELKPTHVIIEANNVGFFINISLHTYSELASYEGNVVKIYTYLIPKEDNFQIYGFFTQLELKIFRLLLTVSGIGPNVSRMILSAISPADFVRAIWNEDVQVLQSIKGIGAKTAQRLVLELKDKLTKTELITENETSTLPKKEQLHAKEEALAALAVLGFSKKQCESVIQKIISQNPHITTEEIIRQALKLL